MGWFSPKIEIVEVKYEGHIFYAIQRKGFTTRYLDLMEFTRWRKLEQSTIIYLAADIDTIKKKLKQFKEGFSRIQVSPLDKTRLEKIIHELE